MKKVFFAVLAIFFAVAAFAQTQPQIQTGVYNARENPNNTITLTRYLIKERDVVIPDTLNDMPVTAIGRIEPNLFYGEFVFSSKKLKSAVIPGSIIVIGNMSFANNRLTEITLPQGLKGIGHYAFRGNRFKTLVIPESVVLIEIFAFQDNPISDLTLHAPFMTSGGGPTGPFFGCPITRLNIPAGIDDETMERNFEASLVNFWKNNNRIGGIFVKNRSVWSLVPGSEKTEIPQAVLASRAEAESLAGKGFFDFFGREDTKLTNTQIQTEDYTARVAPDNTIMLVQYLNKERDIIIPSEMEEMPVTAIGRIESSLLFGAFVFNAKRINSAVIPESVTIIGNMAFANNRLATVVLPPNLTGIGHYAFRGNRIRTLTIPEKVERIELYAFQDNPITELTILKPFTTTGAGFTGPFYGCPITRLTIPANMPDDIMERNFETSLVNFWRNNDRAGGTYVKHRSTWSLTE